MLTEEIDYTIASTDEQNYNRIDVSLVSPASVEAKMVVTSLTTNCNIVVLNTNDYIEINEQRYQFDNDYTDLNKDSFKLLLNSVINDSGVTASVDNAGRLVFTSDSNFKINSCSYNVMLLTGLYAASFPIEAIKNITTSSSSNSSKSESESETSTESSALVQSVQTIIITYKIVSGSVGYYLSTPILYLVSNLGNQCFRPLGRSSSSTSQTNAMTSSKILLRINNSFSADYPIVVNNGDFQVSIPSNDLSHLELTLVDANMKEVHLLNPMYITIKVTPIPDDELSGKILLWYDQQLRGLVTY